jgi:hypothetical protein
MIPIRRIEVMFFYSVFRLSTYIIFIIQNASSGASRLILNDISDQPCIFSLVTQIQYSKGKNTNIDLLNRLMYDRIDRKRSRLGST